MYWLVLAGMMIVLGAGQARAEGELALQHVVTVNAPLYVTHAGDERLFIVERQGRVLIYTEDQGLLATPFLDIQSDVDQQGDGGLFSMAFHPDYGATSDFFFVSYTEDGPNPLVPLTSIVARYEVSAGDPEVADSNSGQVLLSLNQPQTNHNNGQIAFSPADDYLYVGFGDGGSPDDDACRAQLDGPGDFFGKILRLDVDQNVNQAPFYGIPAGNPFSSSGDGIADELWAKGLRNPWRFSFDVNGDLYVGDVGQSTREEVDRQPVSSSGGENYGWRIMEGTTCHDPLPIDPDCPAGTPACFSPAYTAPIDEYATGSHCSITGGFVYRGGAIPDLKGTYVFGDFCSGRIWGLEETAPGVWSRSPLLEAGFGLTSFGQGADGELYVTVGDSVFRLVLVPPVPALAPWARAVLGLVLCAGALRFNRRAGRAGGV